MEINFKWVFVLLTHDRPSDCFVAVNSIWKYSKGFPRIIIVDNPGQWRVGAGCERFWRSGYPLYYIGNEKNFCAYGRNFGTLMAWEMQPRAEFICYIDDDVVITKEWESSVEQIFEDKDVYATGPWGWEVYPDLAGFDMLRKGRGEKCEYLDGSFWIHRFDKAWKIPSFWVNKTWFAEAYIQQEMLREGKEFRACTGNLAAHKRLRSPDFDFEGDYQASIDFVKETFGGRKKKAKARTGSRKKSKRSVCKD